MAVDLVNGQSLERFFQMSNHEFDFSGFKTSVAGLKRTGHARFRRGPASHGMKDGTAATTSESTQYMQAESCGESTRYMNTATRDDSTRPISCDESTRPIETATHGESSQPANTATCGELTQSRRNDSCDELTQSRKNETGHELTHSVKVANCGDLTRSIKVAKCDDLTQSNTTTSGRSFVGEGSVSDGKGIVTPAPVFSSRKPPLPSSHRKRQGSTADGSVSRGCHCCKRRKIRVKKVTSIPADKYSWKKYGEKSVQGSPYPKVYYKCSTARGCPARKRIEVARDDSKMLIVSYAGEHRHVHVHAPTPVPAYLSVPFRR